MYKYSNMVYFHTIMQYVCKMLQPNSTTNCPIQEAKYVSQFHYFLPDKITYRLEGIDFNL